MKLMSMIRWARTGILLMMWMLWLVSCKSPAPVAYVPRPVENAIHESMVQDDMQELIRLYLENPDCRSRVADYLFFSRSYEEDPYEVLLQYREASVADSVLTRGFLYILHERELRILAELSESSLSEIAEYYQQHGAERRFLEPALRRTLLANLADYDYQSLRQIRRAFRATDLIASVDSVYLPAAQVARREQEKNLKLYFLEERKAVKLYQEACLADLHQFVQHAVQEILEDLLEDDLPEGEEAVNRFYEGVFGKYIHEWAVREILQKYVEACQNNLNDGRTYYLSALMEGEQYDGYQAWLYAGEVYLGLNHPVQPLYELSELQNKTDWVGWGLSAASLVANLLSFGTAGTLIDVYDVGRTVENSKTEAEVMKRLVTRFSTALSEELELLADRCVQQCFQEVKRNVNQSQQSFKTIIYENY